MRYLLLIIFWAVLINPAWASYQISCPAENISALNQTNQYTTLQTINGVTTSKTIVYDVPYFNNLFNATDCTINHIADPAPLSATAQQALFKAQMASAQQVAQINAQMEANREAYIDALMSGNTSAQQSIAAAQAALISQKAAIK